MESTVNENCVVPAKTSVMTPAPFIIEAVEKETRDTFTIDLIPENRKQSLTFEPGQFNMLYVFGVGEIPISISGDPSMPGVLKHTTRIIGTVTQAMRKLKVGDSVGVRGPFGSAWPVGEARGKDVVIIAGGIGLAPLRPVIYELLKNRERYRKVVLLYGTRSPEDILYKREFKKWKSKFSVEIYTTVDRATRRWRGAVGVVPNLIKRIPFHPGEAIAMVCGPEIMMKFSVIELQKRGVSLESIFISIERNMKCAVGFCGHCQFGPAFVCKDGPVFPFSRIKNIFTTREI